MDPDISEQSVLCHGCVSALWQIPGRMGLVALRVSIHWSFCSSLRSTAASKPGPLCDSWGTVTPEAQLDPISCNKTSEGEEIREEPFLNCSCSKCALQNKCKPLILHLAEPVLQGRMKGRHTRSLVLVNSFLFLSYYNKFSEFHPIPIIFPIHLQNVSRVTTAMAWQVPLHPVSATREKRLRFCLELCLSFSEQSWS